MAICYRYFMSDSPLSVACRSAIESEGGGGGGD